MNATSEPQHGEHERPHASGPSTTRSLLAAAVLFASVSNLALAQTVSFGPPTHYAAGAQSQVVAAGDFNGDGVEDVVILEGDVERVEKPDDPLVAGVQEAYTKKYKMSHPPPFWVLRPRKAFAWHKDLRSATRFHFRQG